MASATTNGLLNKVQAGATSAGPTGAAAPAVQEVSAAQAERWLRAGEAVLIDVREPDEHAREHIKGARLAPLSGFDAPKVAQLAGPRQKLVMHCRSGRRSADACRMASAMAASGGPIFSLTGGIEAWKGQGLPVEVNKDVSRISVMRQTQMAIGAGVLIGSVLGWFVDPAFIGLAAFFGAGLVFAGATGTCGLATLIAKMPWNKGAGGATAGAGSCSSGRCANETQTNIKR